MTRWRRPRALRRSRWRRIFLLVSPDDEVEKAEGSKEKKVEEDIFVGLTDFNEVVKTHCALELGV